MQKNYIWNNEVKTSIYSLWFYIKVIQKVFKLTFFNANTKLLTLVSGCKRFMLVKVQFMLIEAWLKVLIVLMSLLFVVQII